MMLFPRYIGAALDDGFDLDAKLKKNTAVAFRWHARGVGFDETSGLFTTTVAELKNPYGEVWLGRILEHCKIVFDELIERQAATQRARAQMGEADGVDVDVTHCSRLHLA